MKNTTTKSQRKLNIGIVCYPSIGGSGIVATSLGEQLAKRGHKVHFISYEPPFRLAQHKNIYFHQVPINEYSLFKYPDYTLPLASTISNVHHEYALDILHVHYAVPHATAALLARDICIQCISKDFPKIVTTLHGTDISLLAKDPALAPIIRYAIEASDGVTAVSEWLTRQTHKVLKPRKNIDTIYNFYEPKKPSKAKLNLRFDLKLRPNDFVLVHLSNLREVKRIPDLLMIMKKLKDEPKLKLLIVSGSDFNPYQKLAIKYGIEKKIVVAPPSKAVQNEIAAADVGLFTSETESFGLSVLECQSYGLPVIATHVGGTPEVIQNGTTGFLEKLGDTTKLAKRVLQLKNDRALLTKMSEAATENALRFRASSIVPQYESYYYHLLS